MRCIAYIDTNDDVSVYVGITVNTVYVPRRASDSRYSVSTRHIRLLRVPVCICMYYIRYEYMYRAGTVYPGTYRTALPVPSFTAGTTDQRDCCTRGKKNEPFWWMRCGRRKGREEAGTAGDENTQCVRHPVPVHRLWSPRAHIALNHARIATCAAEHERRRS